MFKQKLVNSGCKKYIHVFTVNAIKQTYEKLFVLQLLACNKITMGAERQIVTDWNGWTVNSFDLNKTATLDKRKFYKVT